MKISAELINKLMEKAIAAGCVTSIEVNRSVSDALRYSKFEYTFDELNRLERDFELNHPDIYPEDLYTWEERCSDPYESDGMYYAYLFSKHQLFSAMFHSVAGGCGHGGTGRYTITSWEKLLADVKAHSGKWEKETWHRICAEYDRHPELRNPSFDELRAIIETMN